MGEIERYQGSNLPEPAGNALGAVTVAASRAWSPWAVGGTAALVVPAVAAHLPVLHTVLGTGEHLPMVGGIVGLAVTVGSGVLGYKYVGKPIQNRARQIVAAHGLE